MNTLVFRRGSTVTILLEAISPAATPLAGIAVTAVLKKLQVGRALVATPAAALFAVTSREADDVAGAGWLLTLPASATAALLGDYVTNAVLTYADGEVDKTDTLTLTFVDASS